MAKRTLFLQFNRLSPWKVALAGALGAVMLVSILALALATFLIVAPIAAVAAAVGGWWMSRGARKQFGGGKRPGHPSVDPRAGQLRRTGRIDVVDAEYTVIEPGKGNIESTGTGNIESTGTDNIKSTGSGSTKSRSQPPQ